MSALPNGELWLVLLLVFGTGEAISNNEILETDWAGPVHSGATPLLRGWSRKNIFCQKIFHNFFSFQATEMVLTSKWGRIQPEIQIWPDQVVASSSLEAQNMRKRSYGTLEAHSAVGEEEVGDNLVLEQVTHWLFQTLLYSAVQNSNYQCFSSTICSGHHHHTEVVKWPPRPQSAARAEWQCTVGMF